MNSIEVKLKVLYYLRFDRGFSFIATECGRFNSDILASNEKEIIEVEAKVTKADLKQEFKKKKHTIYAAPSKYYAAYLPNRFYFAVPESLSEYAKKVVKDNQGIIAVNNKPVSSNHVKQSYCYVVKQAKPLHKTFNPKLHRQIFMRMSSELMRFWLRYYEQDCLTELYDDDVYMEVN